MANNIGTHLTQALDDLYEETMVLTALGQIGADMQSFNSYQNYGWLVEWFTARHSQSVDRLKEFLEKKVIPIVAHINDRVPRD